MPHAITCDQQQQSTKGVSSIRKRAIMDERRERLIQMIQTKHSIHIKDMSAYFDVSTETIRKDLIYLEQQGYLKKSYGGAIASDDHPERAIEPRMREHVERKRRIADCVLDHIPSKGILILDAGSTVYQVSQKLAQSEDVYTIITNSINTANALANTKHTLLLVGGEVRNATMAMTGVWAINAFQSIKADVAILGTSGFMSHDGPCAEAFVEADVKKAIMQSSRKHIVLADSTKFQSDALVEYASWDQIDLLITDAEVPEDKLTLMQNQTHVVTV